MASRRSKRRPQRAGFPWEFIWFIAFGSVIIVALHSSPLTQVRRVQVTGVNEQDRTRIQRVISRMRGIPSGKVPSEEIEELVEANLGVQSARLSTNIFGSGSLAVVMRQPVALFEDGLTALDPQGNIFSYRSPNRPRLTVSKNVQDYAPILSLCDPSRYRQIAQIAKKLQLLTPKLAGKVAPDERGALCLYIGELTVEFGDVRDLDKKLELLVQKLSDVPELVESRARINLVDPSNPMIDPIE